VNFLAFQAHLFQASVLFQKQMKADLSIFPMENCDGYFTYIYCISELDIVN